MDRPAATSVLGDLRQTVWWDVTRPTNALPAYQQRQRERFERAYEPWSDDEMACLKRGVQARLPLVDLCDAFGRQPGGITAKAWLIAPEACAAAGWEPPPRTAIPAVIPSSGPTTEAPSATAASMVQPPTQGLHHEMGTPSPHGHAPMDGHDHILGRPMTTDPAEHPQQTIARIPELTGNAQPGTMGWDAQGRFAVMDHAGAIRPLAVIDTETGGFKPGRAALLSIAVSTLHRHRGIATTTRYLLPEPGAFVAPAAAAVNGYSRQAWASAVMTDPDGRRLTGAVPLQQGLRDIAAVLGNDHAAAAYNARFDHGFVSHAARATQVDIPVCDDAWVCPMAMAKHLVRGSHALADVFTRLTGEPPGQTHDAGADTRLAILVMARFAADGETAHWVEPPQDMPEIPMHTGRQQRWNDGRRRWHTRTP